MTRRGVIFDLDGVLVSTDELHYAAWKALAEREGIPFDRETNRRLRGVSRMASLDLLLERAPRAYSAEEKAGLAAYKNSLYVRLLDGLTARDLLPGVPELLHALERRGVPMAVASSSKNARRILARTGLAARFRAVADGTEIQNSKPDPEVFLLAAAKLGLRPEDCAVVEDAEAGLRAARAAGMLACGVGAAAGSKLAQVRLHDIRELARLCERNG